MKTKAPTLRQFQDRFPTEESCLDHLMRTRFGERHICDKCGKDAKFYRVKARRSYACEWCGAHVYPTAGTPFDRTRTSLRDWFHVMFLFTTSRSGVAAKEVERQIGVTYKTAWRMCHEIRKYMAIIDGDDFIGGAGKVVEVDEAFFGGEMLNVDAGNYRSNKAIVVAMHEKGGKVVTLVVPDTTRATLWAEIEANIARGTVLHTDEYTSYRSITLRGYGHQRVNHTAKEYVAKDGTTTNSVEGFWSQLKRSINGTHIHVSRQHLAKYLGEFEFCHNMRHAPHLMIDRLLTSFGR
jgi:transposase